MPTKKAKAQKTASIVSVEKTVKVKKCAPGTLQSTAHIFFFKEDSPLSNWHISGQLFPGDEPLRYLMSRLDALNIDRPSMDNPLSQAICAHNFNCGEQWLMACKAWIFDSQNLYAILQSANPKKQKSLGRSVENYQEKVWAPVSQEVCIAGTVARARVDQGLADIYRHSGSRQFAEGSRSDTVWGVGLSFDDPMIVDPKNWRGGNRLGKCHDESREISIRDLADADEAKADSG